PKWTAIAQRQASCQQLTAVRDSRRPERPSRSGFQQRIHVGLRDRERHGGSRGFPCFLDDRLEFGNRNNADRLAVTDEMYLNEIVHGYAPAMEPIFVLVSHAGFSMRLGVVEAVA